MSTDTFQLDLGARDDDTEGVPTLDTKQVDEVNAAFYGRYPYPPLAHKYDRVEDPDFERRFLCQNVGDYRHARIPLHPSILVAGCGMNQAIETALRFPDAQVLGIDLSVTSLETCQRNATALGLTNLRLEQKSITDLEIKSQFDYVICTGVIHHTANPEHTLQSLADSLKPDGILELMVYNTYHRAFPVAIQRAVNLLTGPEGATDFKRKLEIVWQLAAGLDQESRMAQWLRSFENKEESHIADVLIQPVEYTYTVETLQALALRTGLELAMPTVSPLMKHLNLNISWNLMLTGDDTRQQFEALPDVDRWQVANLLMHDTSPLLWFYLQKREASFHRLTVRETVDAFLASTWKPARSSLRAYVRGPAGNFTLSSRKLPYPMRDPTGPLSELYQALADPTYAGGPLADVWRGLGMPDFIMALDEARLHLTTSAFPHLVCVEERARS